MNHSKRVDSIQEWYALGMWNEQRMRDAVEKKWISAEEFKQITGKDY